MIYPTLIVWLIISIPFVLYTCAGIYYLGKRTSQSSWEYDASGYFLGIFTILLMVTLCVGLYVKRPRKIINIPKKSLTPDG
jgi:hypothetical protein